MQAFQDIFISYGRRDSLAFASRLNRRLVDLGFTVWFDYDDIPLGVDYQKQIDDGIERADNFVFVMSPHSINSPYCGLELELALKHNKRIIPWLHVERISYETWLERNPQGTEAEWQDYQGKGLHDHFQNMHPLVRKINWIYGREDQDNFEAAFAGLLEICDRSKDYVHQHTLLLAKALDWERNQKRSSYLLIGEERLKAEEWLKVRFPDSQPPCLPTALHCEFITESRKNAENLMTEVFLAYAEENRGTAEKIRNSLRREGFTVWTNTTDIHAGNDFQKVIERGIEETDSVVYLLSPAAVRSGYCQHELEYALSLQKRIIPVLVEETPSDQIPLKLRNLQYIDLTDNQEESDYDLDESQLLKALRQEATYHGTHKHLLTKALKWDRQHRNPTLLLRGYNLQQAEAWLKLAQQTPAYPALPLQEAFIAESVRQPPGLSLDVFISYSRADSGFARRINDALQLQGKRTWFDQESIAAGTADFQQEIHHGIESSDIFLFILSPRSITSPYCADEVEYAANFNKRFVTILHQPIDTTDLHPELGKVQWLDFNRNDGDFSANLTELLRILDTDSEHLHAHTRLLLRAIEWDEKNRRESLLLRRDELETAEAWLAQNVGKDPQPTELQQSYIANSRSVEDAQHQAEQILKAAAAKGKQLVRLGAIVGSVGILVAAFAGWFAVQTAQKVKVADLRLVILDSKQDFLKGQELKALVKALEAGQALRTGFRENSKSWQELQPFVMGALQQSIYNVREKNSLEGHTDWVGSIQFSPDGKTIASGCNDSTVKLWNASTGQELHTLSGHTEGVSDIQFSPDGKTIASSSGDKTIKLWNVETGQLLHPLEGHTAEVWDIQFSPDGKTIASGSGDKTIKLWDVETGQERQTLKGHMDWVSDIQFSPDGKTIASGSGDKTIKLWDVETGQLLHPLEGHTAEVWDIQFSPDGKTIASSSGDNTIKLWEVATGKVLHTLEGHTEGVNSIQFSPDGKTIASGSWDKTIKLWEVATGKVLHTLEGHTDGVGSIQFSPNGKAIASSSGDKTIKLWEVATGKVLHTLEGHTDGVGSIQFSPDGKAIASASWDSTIKLWNMETGQLLHTLSGHTEGVRSIQFSPDGKTIASGSEDNTVELWDGSTGQLLYTMIGHTGGIRSIQFSPDGKTIASGSGDNTIKLWAVDTSTLAYHRHTEMTFPWNQPNLISFSPDGKTIASLNVLDSEAIKTWDVQTGSLIHTFQGQGWEVRFSPDGKTIASGSEDNTIKLWEAETGQPLHTLVGHTKGVNSIQFSPDGKTIASGSWDSTIKLWEAETEQPLHTLLGHTEGVLSIQFSPDGKTIASASWDNTVKLWNVETGNLTQTLNGHQDQVLEVSFSPDGQVIASSSEDQTVKLWNVETGQLIHTLKGHQQGVNYLNFSLDGKLIASGSKDGTIRLWNVQTGSPLYTLKTGGKWTSGVSFSPDAKMIASSNTDGTLKLWDIQTGSLIYTLGENQYWIQGLMFSPDGKTIVSGGVDGTIKRWVWDFDRLMAMGCNWIELYLITRPEESDRCEGYLPPDFKKVSGRI